MADIYENPTVADWPPRWTDGRARHPLPPTGAPDTAQDAGRPGRLHDPAADHLRPALADLDRRSATTCVTRCADASCLPTVSWAWVLVGWLLLVSPPAGWCSAPSARGCCCGGCARDLPPRRQDAPAAVARRAARGRVRGAQPRRGPLDGGLRARPRRHGGADVDLHSVPPVTGMLTLGDGCSVEPEVDLRGYWLDGDVLHVGHVGIGADARVGTRSTLGAGSPRRRRAPRSRPGPPSSAPYGAGSSGPGPPPSGSARRAGPGRARAPARTSGGRRRTRRPPSPSPSCRCVALAGGLPRPGPLAAATSLGDAAAHALLVLPVAVAVALVVLAVLVVAAVRVVGIGLEPGHHPVHSRQAWQAWVDPAACSTRRAPGSTRSTPARSPRCGCAPWAPGSGAAWRRRPCCSSPG